MPTIDTNMKLKAPAQFSNYDFNSLCNFNGMKLGVNNNGLYKILCGDADGTAEIDAYFTIATTDYGVSNTKKFRFMYFGYISDDDLKITISVDEGTPIDIILTSNKDGLQCSRKSITRELHGRYWTIKVANTNGADFSVNDIEALLIILSQGHK